MAWRELTSIIANGTHARGCADGENIVNDDRVIGATGMGRLKCDPLKMISDADPVRRIILQNKFKQGLLKLSLNLMN